MLTASSPGYLATRLEYLRQVRGSRFDAPELRSPSREIARSLGGCIQGDDGLARKAAELLRAQAEEAFQGCNVETAIVEVLWPYLHPRSGEGPIAKLKMEAEFTKEVNTYLRSRGEILTFTGTEIGKKVAELRLSSKRNGSGNLLLLNRETSRRIHRLARIVGTGRKMPRCQDCEEPSGPDAGAIMAEQDRSSVPAV